MTIDEFKIKSILWLIHTFGRLPLKFHYFWGGIVSWLMRGILHYRRDVVITNLARSFPEKQYGEIRSIASAFYKHLGDIMAEAIWFGASDYKRLKEQRICTMTNIEVLNEAYENSPSVTVLFSHCGNWEVLGGIWSYNFNESFDYPCGDDGVKVVYKKLRSHVWDEVLKKNRCAPLVNYQGEIESERVLRYCIQHRKDRFIYIFPADQYPYSGVHEVGEFLHQNTKAMQGSVGVAHKLGMSVLYMKMKHVSRGHYEMTFVPISMDASKETPEVLLRKYFDLLEEEIRETPYNWLWSHKRWK